MNSIYHSPLAMSRLRLFPLTVIHYTIFFIVHNREIGQNFKNRYLQNFTFYCTKPLARRLDINIIFYYLFFIYTIVILAYMHLYFYHYFIPLFSKFHFPIYHIFANSILEIYQYNVSKITGPFTQDADSSVLLKKRRRSGLR